MKKFLVLILVLCFFLSSNLTVKAASKIGVVDGEMLFDRCPAAQAASKKIADAQEDLRQVIADSEKKLSEFEKEKKSETEKLNKQRELQTAIDAKAKKTKDLIEQISSELEKDILATINEIAQKKGLELVVDKRAVLVGGTDITDEVAEALKKKTPIANNNSENKEGKF